MWTKSRMTGNIVGHEEDNTNPLSDNERPPKDAKCGISSTAPDKMAQMNILLSIDKENESFKTFIVCG